MKVWQLCLWYIWNGFPCPPLDDCRKGGGPCWDAHVRGASCGVTAVGEPAETGQMDGTSVPGAKGLGDPQTQPGRSDCSCDIWGSFRSKGACMCMALFNVFLVALDVMVSVYFVDACGLKEKMRSSCVFMCETSCYVWVFGVCLKWDSKSAADCLVCVSAVWGYCRAPDTASCSLESINFLPPHFVFPLFFSPILQVSFPTVRRHLETDEHFEEKINRRGWNTSE